MPRQTVYRKHGGDRKHGRALEKCQKYRSHQTREKNKSKRVLQSNGKKACEAYCKRHRIRLPSRYHMIKDEGEE